MTSINSKTTLHHSKKGHRKCSGLYAIRVSFRILNTCSFCPFLQVTLTTHMNGFTKHNKYNVYIFSEPKSGFQIAFNMFDTDGNQRVDKNEFLVVSWMNQWIWRHFVFSSCQSRMHLKTFRMFDFYSIFFYEIYSWNQITRILGGSLRKQNFDDQTRRIVRYSMCEWFVLLTSYVT